ncbi:copper resistance D family protein [Azospirillum sp. sgz301742]
MALLIDVFGLLSVLLRGLVLVGTVTTVGGIAFLALLVRPLRGTLGAFAGPVEARSRRLLRIAAAGLAVTVALDLAVETAILVGTTDLSLAEVAGADFVRAGTVAFLAALTAAALAGRRGVWPLLPLAALLVGAAVATSHAAARPEERGLLLVLATLHHAGAAVWVGGIPFLVGALALVGTQPVWARIGRRFSWMAIGAVASLLAGGIGMGVAYVGDPTGLFGTAYGVMLTTKVLLAAAMLGLGLLNYRLIERAVRGEAAPAIRMRRFAEAEIGIGMTVLFAAASLTSLPPAVDLAHDRVTMAEIVERLEPRWPSLATPAHGSLGIPSLQATLDAEAHHHGGAAPPAFVPGSGAPPPRNAADIAWSEYNHHWAGLILLAVGLAALLEKSGRASWARNWPLLFLGLAAFLLVRADPESWPLGDIGFLEGFREPEVMEHRFFVVLISAFALFEWGVRTGRLRTPWMALVFPLICAVGGGVLLTHSHSLANVREELLIEITHTPLAVLGVAAGWSRWLEIRLPEGDRRIPAHVWPVCFVLVGLVLLGYREA